MTKRSEKSRSAAKPAPDAERDTPDWRRRSRMLQWFGVVDVISGIALAIAFRLLSADAAPLIASGLIVACGAALWAYGRFVVAKRNGMDAKGAVSPQNG